MKILSNQWKVQAAIALTLVACSEKHAFRDTRVSDSPANASDSQNHANGSDSHHSNGGDSDSNSNTNSNSNADNGNTTLPDHSPGQPDVLAKQSFLQVEKSKMDMLWVIDNSRSMAPYQEILANNFSSFAQSAASWGADLQVGVTSTDMCPRNTPTDLSMNLCPDGVQRGRGLQGNLAGDVGHRVIKNDSVNFLQSFSDLSTLGTDGAPFEHGLTAAQVAIEKSLSGANEELVRDDSFLAVILVSDEMDDGVGLSQVDENGVNWWAAGKTRYRYAADDLVHYLTTVRPNGRFSVSSIVGTSATHLAGCANGHRPIEQGSEQMRASTLSGGSVIDLCNDNWSESLSRMADDFNRQLASFQLSKVPTKPEMISVSVNGQQQLSGWSYIPSRNTIVFATGSVPQFGDHVDVTFPTRRK